MYSGQSSDKKITVPKSYLEETLNRNSDMQLQANNTNNKLEWKSSKLLGFLIKRICRRNPEFVPKYEKWERTIQKGEILISTWFEHELKK